MPKIDELLVALGKRGLTLGSVESLTAGLFGATVCEIPGASAVYRGGLITYSPTLKTALAHVNPETIERHGVVCAEVAKEMAIGGQKALGVDICVSCTGNAGPTAEEGEAPVGRVYLGLCFKGSVWTIPLDFKGDRNEVRKKAVSSMVSFVSSLLTIPE